MPHYDKALAVLWNAEVDGVETSEFDRISKFLQFVDNQIKIPSVRKHEISDVLKKKQAGIEPLDGIDENGEAVAGVIHALLLSADAKRLARRPSYDDIGGRVVKPNLKFNLGAGSLQIAPVCFNSGMNHLKAMSCKPCSLETKRQPTASREEIDDLLAGGDLRNKEI